MDGALLTMGGGYSHRAELVVVELGVRHEFILLVRRVQQRQHLRGVHHRALRAPAPVLRVPESRQCADRSDENHLCCWFRPVLAELRLALAGENWAI
jgi:hypothetical protein